MASQAESSVASVPIPNLELLQQHLLNHIKRSPSAPPPQQPQAPTRQDADKTHSTTNNATLSEHITVEILERSPKPHAPSLSAPKTAPEIGMSAMVQPTPSQKAFAALTRGTTFHGYQGGDTQPMDTQVYRDYTESMAKPRETTPEKSVIHLKMSANGESTSNIVVTDRTPKTLAEGDTGFVDLVGAYQLPSPTAHSIHSASDIDDLLASPQTQLGVEEVAKIAMPETPALAGHKRRSSGEIVTSDPATAKTLGFFQLLSASKGPMLSATQLFNQTQAPSSPLPDAPRSDPVATRPSPNLNHHFSVSSPAAVGSSLMLTMHARPSSVVGEPRDTYTSMRESQERRAARLRKELDLDSRFGEHAILEQDEDDEDSGERRMERKRLQRVMSEQALNDWTKIRAPFRPGSRPASSRKLHATIDLVTPATTRKGDRVDFDISDDGRESEDDAPPESDHEAQYEEADENDVYDELGQTVLRSQRDDREDEGDRDLADNNQAEVQHEERPINEAELEDAQIPDLVEQYAEAEIDGAERVITATQRSAIADSQPKQGTRRSLLARRYSQPSSISYVPGSQYVGATSQELGRRANSGHRTTAREESKVPSSPPVCPAEDTVPTSSAEASLLRQQVLARFKKPAAPRDLESKAEQEIPESDLPDHDQGFQQAEYVSEPQAASESNSVPQLYSTARSHLSGSGFSPTKPAPVSLTICQSQHSSLSSPSPRKAAGVRRFGDIAADPCPPDASGEASGEASFDVDAIMSDVMTADDQQFINAISSPPSERLIKRRKLTRLESRSPSPKKGVLRQPSITAAEGQQGEHSSPQKGICSVTGNANAAPEKAVKVLRNSPSKANELPESTPDEPLAAFANTPESVRRREAEGATAMSHLLSVRVIKPAKAAQFRGSNRQNVKTTPAPGKPTTETKRPRLRLQKPQKPPDGEFGRFANSPSVVPAVVNAAADVEKEAAVDGQGNAPAIVAPDRIFALFRGSYNAYYPATWLGTSADGKSYRVKFDDTTVTLIDSHQVSTLELRIDDQVKVDVPGMRSKTWIVKGFGLVADTAEAQTPGVDIHGHTTVKVQAKASRNSMPTSGLVTQGDGDLVDAHITSMYLTHTVWPHFEVRAFTPPTGAALGSSRNATPSTGVQTPLSVETPSFRARRSIVTGGNTTGPQTSRLREGSSASSSRSSSAAGIFNGMAFAISYGSNEGEKTEVTRLIRSHGGMILDDGLEELFTVSGLDEHTTPSKRSTKAPTVSCENSGLQLKAEYSHLGFVALVADRHSRRAKYMQALALGLPTLSGRWITDSLTARKNDTLNQADATPLAWKRYLLPAGESSCLGGAIKSRTLLAVQNPTRLTDFLHNRDVLIDGGGVLIVSPKKGKGTWERRKAYAFLTLAIGADIVKRVAAVQEAKVLMEGDPDLWRWVYVDGSVAEAASALFGKQLGAGKKRKRGDNAINVDARAMSAGDSKVRIVNDEFVVQSLILGALVD